MQSKTSGAVFLLFCLLLGALAFAQMGYPLKGSWSGDWWLKKGEENHILLEFDWDGKTLTGVLNPGTDNVVLQKLSLEPPTGGVERAMDQARRKVWLCRPPICMPLSSPVVASSAYRRVILSIRQSRTKDLRRRTEQREIQWLARRSAESMYPVAA